MSIGWIALALIYLMLLFWIAKWGERKSLTATKFGSHPLVYCLALGIYCTAWTFYGAVGQSSSEQWMYLPILLGPVIVYLVFNSFIYKLVHVSKEQRISTISDFISARYGKRQTVALMVTIIALLATIPYIALQLKAISVTFETISDQQNSQVIVIMASIFIGLFAMYFGTRNTDVTQYRRGLMLAIAFESCIKLIALILVAIVAYQIWQTTQSGDILADYVTPNALHGFTSLNFWFQTLMAGAAVICLPRQFHITVIDNIHLSHIRHARWVFPLYLVLIAITIPIIATAGNAIFANSDVNADSYVMSIAIFKMEVNRVGRIKMVRRLVIAGILLLAFAYQQFMANHTSLASMGLVAFSLVIHLLPAIVGGLYWQGAHAHGVYAGLLTGLVVWFMFLLYPLIEPHSALYQSAVISEGAIISLLANTAAFIAFSLMSSPRLIDRIQAEAFTSPAKYDGKSQSLPESDVWVSDLKTLVSRFTGPARSQHLFEQFEQEHTTTLIDDEQADHTLLLFCEKALGGVVGSSSAKALIDSIVQGKKLDVTQVVNFFDDTTQAMQFNMSALLTSLGSIEQGISVIDKDLNLVAWNKRYLSLFSYPEELVYVGAPIESLIRFNAQRGECGPGEEEALVQRRMEHLRMQICA